MATVADAIMALIPDEQWVLRGDPTTEAEFNAMFRRVIGEDENGTAVSPTTLTTGVYRGQPCLRRRRSLMRQSH